MSTEPPHVSSPRESEAEEARGDVVSKAHRWDASFAQRSRLFWPIAGALELLVRSAASSAGAGAGASHDGLSERLSSERLSDDGCFPQPETIDAALGARAGVRFERQRPVSRRRRAPRDPASMYDARIARAGCVPTRPGSWHDLMNALVWATFPLAKRTLHERQHRLVVPAAPGESARRPRELDALALLDEGGVVVLGDAGSLAACLAGAAGASKTDPSVTERERALEAAIAAGDATAFVFGHAIYEGLVLGRPPPLASVVVGLVGADEEVGEVGEVGEGAAGRVRPSVEAADRALAAVLADPLRIVEPTGMLRLRADERLLASSGRD